MSIDLSQEEKVSFLVSLCSKMGLSADEILSMYLLIGDNIFFIFDLLQGKSVKFPSMRSFHRLLSSVSKIKYSKLSKLHYLINGVDAYREDIKRGDTVRVEGVDIVALSSPLVVFGETYILSECLEDDL